MKLSVVVPCYNEEKNIAPLAERFSIFIKNRKDKNREDIEVILVNNGSGDSSKRIMHMLCRKYGFLRIVNIKKNIGYGNGIFQGLKRANGDFLCWTHGDLQTDPKDVFTAYDVMREMVKNKENPELIFVKGNRRKRNFLDSVFTFGMSFLISIILRSLMRDINAQPNLFHKSFLKRLKNPPKDFNLELYSFYIAKRNKFKIIRFPVSFNKRLSGESHWNKNLKSKIKHIRNVICYSLRLKNVANNP